MEVSKLFIAPQAVIIKDGKVLLIRESAYADGTNERKFNVVGGRMHLGERFNEGLMREVKEETGLEIKVGKPFFVGEWRPVVRGEQWQIVGIFFECLISGGKLSLGDEHDRYIWVDPREYKNYPIIEDLPEMFEEYLLFKKLK